MNLKSIEVILKRMLVSLPVAIVTVALAIAAPPISRAPAATVAVPALRYMYDTHKAVAATNGWNLLDTGTDKATIDNLPAGTRSLVWIGDYDNTTCSFEVTDSQVTAALTPLVGDPKVAGYFISDEPDPYACPSAYSQHAARSNLVDSIDPTKFTVIVLDSNSGQASLDQMPSWAGIGDYQGLDPYPCYVKKACNYSWIDTVIAKADTSGLNYWGVVQSFKDTTWRFPTTDELNHMLGQWSASNWQGLATFAWKWAGHCLCKHTDLLSAWKTVNGQTGGGSDPFIGAAGDISPPDTSGGDGSTSDELINDGVDHVLTLGDDQYESGLYNDFVNYYDKRWGRLKAITYPAPGNHEYGSTGAAGYYQYFQTGTPVSPVQPYYSFDLGAWHLISLNMEVSAGSGSAQEAWLKSDLAEHPTACTLAYWHEPRFSSGSVHGNSSTSNTVWKDLYAAHADVVLNGHDHDYERFAPQSPTQAADAHGITEFVVGTGGGDGLYSFGTVQPNSLVRYNGNYGVIELMLHPTWFDYSFKTITGSVIDSGTQSCV